MKITFLAHASFLIETEKNIRIITDPYEAGCFNNALGYKPINEKADIVLISHDHADHNCLTDILTHPQVIKTVGTTTIKDIKITGINSYHDTQSGNARGKNIIFVIEADDIRIAHLGDLGHNLSENDYSQLKPIDILLAPVGGYFTIDHKVASEIYNSLKPKVMIPMHYKTSVLDFPISKVDDFIKGKDNVKKISQSTIEISKETLPINSEIWVLNMSKI